MSATHEHLPEILIQAEILERLETLVNTASKSYPETVIEYLERELDRATVMDAGNISTPQAVTMYSIVTFMDEATQEERKAMLVYPHEADIRHNKLSVLSPIGAALIGMLEGKSISWYTPGGQKRVLKVLHVQNP